jgi:hypothetical protein
MHAQAVVAIVIVGPFIGLDDPAQKGGADGKGQDRQLHGTHEDQTYGREA